jgi:hypothetical protein
MLFVTIAGLEHQSVEAGLELRDYVTVDRMPLRCFSRFSPMSPSTGVLANGFRDGMYYKWSVPAIRTSMRARRLP